MLGACYTAPIPGIRVARCGAEPWCSAARTHARTHTHTHKHCLAVQQLVDTFPLPQDSGRDGTRSHARFLFLHTISDTQGHTMPGNTQRYSVVHCVSVN